MTAAVTTTVTSRGVYELLPAELRRLDGESGGTVQALVQVLAEQLAAVEADIDRLGEDWFIETCAEWVVPYIGDLLGARGVHQIATAGATAARARVANTLRFRRRKGTLAMLEQLARDATGWPAKAVEFFELLSATQHLNHLRQNRPASADLRRADALELVDGPFDSFAHTVDIRPMPGGRFNIPNVGLFVWPIPSYSLDRAAVVPVADPDDGRYRADPLGADRPLLMPPATESGIEQFAQEENVPGLLRRRPLFDELERLRAGDPVNPRFFGDRPVFRVHVGQGTGDPLALVPAERLHVCDLSTWRRPTQAGHVNVDPVLGRLSFPAGAAPARVAFSSAYGFGGDVGAGTYSRRDGLPVILDRPLDFQVGVRTPEPGEPAEPGVLYDSLAAAVAAWNAFDRAHPGSFGLITVLDNQRYAGELTGDARITVAAGSKLAIVAAHWPATPGDLPGQTVRRLGRIDPAGLRPCVAGRIEVLGTAIFDEPGELLLDGLLVDGDLRVVGQGPANLGRLTLQHTTLVGDVRVDSGNPELAVSLHRCIAGPVTLPETVSQLTVDESIVRTVTAGDTDVVLDRVTVLGGVTAHELEASDSLFTGQVRVQRRQGGCVRFSYVPPGSQTPRQHRCQPDTAVEESGDPPDEVRARLVPRFVSEDFGDPGYAYLTHDTPEELRTGADDGAEMGVFGIARQPQRLTNLTTALDEFLPFGLAAAPLTVTGEE
jgi:hypothetical protein